MDEFSITVTGVTRTEYFQACRLTARRLYATLAVLMVVICAVIILAMENVSVAALVGPLVVFLLVVVVCEVGPRIGYKGQLETITPITYSFGPLGWRAQMEGQEPNRIEWEATPKLSKTRDCLFLFNGDTSSSLLPLRLLTAEQVGKIRAWYQATRELSKEYEKKKMRKERQEFKDNHQGLRFGSRGPAWGPRKWRQDSEKKK